MFVSLSDMASDDTMPFWPFGLEKQDHENGHHSNAKDHGQRSSLARFWLAFGFWLSRYRSVRGHAPQERFYETQTIHQEECGDIIS